MIKTHDLKIDMKYLEQIATGSKTFEVRKNDRDFKVGDYVLLKEFDRKSNSYGNNHILVKITYVLNDENYCKEGYVIFGIEVIINNCILTMPF